MRPIVEFSSLDQIGPGRRVVLRALNGDRDLRGRLMLLGLFVGAAAEVLQRRRGGPVLIRVRNTLVAVGNAEAKAILVDLAE